MTGRTSLRRASAGDQELLFEWRNRPEIVALGASGSEVSAPEHAAWFAALLDDAERLQLIIEVDGSPAGQIRFVPAGPDHPGAWEVSIYLIQGHLGLGRGARALEQALALAWVELEPSAIVAVVLSDNIASRRLFERQGFVATGADPDRSVVLVLDRPASVPHNRLTHDEAEVDAVAAVVRSGHWAGGPVTAELEAALAEVAGVAHAVCLSSGTDALRLVLQALGVAGERVAVPAYSCVALADAALASGAEPVPLDVVDAAWTLDPNGAGSAAASGVRVAVAVNTFGLPADVEPWSSVGVDVVEDCAHAFGVAIDGRPLGGRSRAAILSFHATKLIGGGEGGAVLTDDPWLADEVRSWRDYDEEPADARRSNNRSSDVEAALALAQLGRLPELLAARADRAAHYLDRLDRWVGRAGLALPVSVDHRVWYRFVIETSHRADAIVQGLEGRGVHAAQPVTRWHVRAEAPNSDRAFSHLVSIPLYPTLSRAEQERTIAALGAVLQHLEESRP